VSNFSAPTLQKATEGDFFSRFDSRPEAAPRLPHTAATSCQSRSARSRVRRGDESSTRALRFGDADLDRQILLGFTCSGRIRHDAEIVALWSATTADTRSRFLHISDAQQKGGSGAHEGADKEITFTREGGRDPQQASSRRLREYCDTKFTGTKRFGLTEASR